VISHIRAIMKLEASLVPEISSTTQYQYYAATSRIERPCSTVFPVARGMPIKQGESEVLQAKVPGQWLKGELLNR